MRPHGRMESYALKEADNALDSRSRHKPPVRFMNGTPTGTDLALKANVGGQPIRSKAVRSDQSDGRGRHSTGPSVQGIDTRVRTGFLRGTPTQEIAEVMMIDTTIGAKPGVRLNAPVTRQIRIRRWQWQGPTASMAKECEGDGDYKANADALEGLVWEWEAALFVQPVCPSISSGGIKATAAGPIGHCTPTGRCQTCWWTQRTPSLLIRSAPPW